MKKTFSDPYIQKKINKIQRICEEKGLSPSRIILTLWSRQSTILEEHVGFRVRIHNGKTFKQITVRKEMVGKKFGEFAPTRKFVTHKKKKKA